LEETIWALKNVSFEVKGGEVVGIIGRNGAGKTTLLKVLSRITKPTAGCAEVRGRVGSLLEVGTGFHPELTGRENIYLNGAILGMKKAEIERKFDEIVAFAEIEKFMDTPVKRYSSGMYVRLAFAVAAHLEPEILLVDEVLAVGDAQFQKKCLGKMGDVAREGRTVLFVSHNMAAITRLCPRTVLLDEGRVLIDGNSQEVVSAYLKSDLGTAATREWPDLQAAPGDHVVRLRAVRVLTEEGCPAESVQPQQPVGLEMEFDVLESGYVLVPIFHIFSERGGHLFSAADRDPAWQDRPRPSGRFVSVVWVPENLFNEGRFTVNVSVNSADQVINHFYAYDAVSLIVADSLHDDYQPTAGSIRPAVQWTTRFLPQDR
jgi:lipopolysaccharide transport system ATP-binding protein